MTLVHQVLSAASPVMLVIAFAMVASRRRIVRRLERAGAVSPNTAVPLGASRPLTRWWRGRLEGAGVLKLTGDDRYWLDIETWRRYRAARRRRVFSVLGILALFAAAWLIWRAFASSGG